MIRRSETTVRVYCQETIAGKHHPKSIAKINRQKITAQKTVTTVLKGSMLLDELLQDRDRNY